MHAAIDTKMQKLTDGALRERRLEVEDGAGLGRGVVVVEVGELPSQVAAHVLIDHIMRMGWGWE